MELHAPTHRLLLKVFVHFHLLRRDIRNTHALFPSGLVSEVSDNGDVKVVGEFPKRAFLCPCVISLIPSSSLSTL